MLGLALHYMRGTPFIYQGEEIGMTNYPFEDESQLRDIESLEFLKKSRLQGKEEYAWKGIKAKGRDNARTPFQWNSSANGGFSTHEPWLASNPNHTYINAADEEKDPDSVLSFYRRMIAFRNGSEILRKGEQKFLLHDDPDILAYERTFGSRKITLFCNFCGEERSIPEAKGDIIFSSPASDRDKLEPFGYIVCEQG
jgi:oligo-1,6-glucosidase